MKINEMIMVIENDKGTEINSLCSLGDYLSRYVLKATEEDLVRAELIAELVRNKYENNSWTEIYAAANHTIQAKYCRDLNDLKAFILRCYNDAELDFDISVYRSSPECIQVLDSMGIAYNDNWSNFFAVRHEKIPKEFEHGEVLHNMNGSAYRILEKISDRNLLLLDVEKGTFVIGIGTDYYARYPRAEGIQSDNCIYGIEWQHGVYLGELLTEIDFKKIRQEYGREEEKMQSRTDREELEDKFNELYTVSQNAKLTDAVCEVAKEALYDEFGTSRREVFMDRLEKGMYDSLTTRRSDKVHIC